MCVRVSAHTQQAWISVSLQRLLWQRSPSPSSFVSLWGAKSIEQKANIFNKPACWKLIWFVFHLRHHNEQCWNMGQVFCWWCSYYCDSLESLILSPSYYKEGGYLITKQWKDFNQSASMCSFPVWSMQMDLLFPLTHHVSYLQIESYRLFRDCCQGHCMNPVTTIWLQVKVGLRPIQAQTSECCLHKILSLQQQPNKKTAKCHVNKISGSIFISFYLCTHMFAVGGDTINIWFKGSFFFVITFFMHNYLNIHSAAQFAEHFELKMCFKLSSLKSNEYAQLTWKLGQWPGPHLSDKSLIKLRKNWHS